METEAQRITRPRLPTQEIARSRLMPRSTRFSTMCTTTATSCLPLKTVTALTPQLVLNTTQAVSRRRCLPKIFPFSCRARSLYFVGHRDSILGWSNRRSCMWPCQGGDAGPGLQESLGHCTVPTTSATFHLLVGPWGVGGKTGLEFEGQQSPQGFA